jgi:molybdopterin-guanine dinucleotide biosynthesis protein A
VTDASKELTAFVLAGGLSTRMGRDKAVLRLNGQPVIERLVCEAAQVAAQVHVVVDHHEKLKRVRIGGALVLEDAVPKRGPLGGIYTGLLHTTTNWNLFLTCDMPLVTSALLLRLTRNATERNEAAHFQVSGEPHCQCFPLLLHRRVLERVRTQIEHDRLSVRDFLGSLNVKTITVTSRAHDRVLVNVNTPDDLRWLRAAVKSRSG